jgi:hypothetical protein
MQHIGGGVKLPIRDKSLNILAPTLLNMALESPMNIMFISMLVQDSGVYYAN